MKSKVRKRVIEYVDGMSDSEASLILNIIELIFAEKIKKKRRRKIKPEDITSFPIGVPDPIKREELYGDRG